MKPTKDFRLSKSAKRLIANEPNKNKRDHLQRMFVEAEVIAAIKKKSKDD